MWKYLYQLASPKTFYHRTETLLVWLGLGALFFLSIGFIWGLAFAPSDYQQKDAFRIIYIHVPGAFLSLALFAFMGFLAALLLIWRIKLAGLMLSVIAPLGAWMTFIALITGSIWGKPMWGTWWIWDARLTSELILLFLYLGILIVKTSFAHKEQGEKIAAVLTLVGLVDLPIIHYSVYWWNTLHQGGTLTLFAKPKIALSMLCPLLFTISGFALYSMWVIIHKARQELLLREKMQQWVKILLENGKL